MEVFHKIPKNQRNNFADPMQHMNAAKEEEPGCENCASADEVITVNGNLILKTMRQFGSKMTVDMALFVRCREMQTIAKITPPPGGWAGMESVIRGQFLTAMKHLANSGFIKLSDNADFGKREILQYHATAEPTFRCGKFQL